MHPKTKHSVNAIIPDWAYVEKQLSSGVIKVTPQDFIVEEELGFALSGEGEHVWVYVEKTQQNTLDLLNIIAHKLNVSPKDVAYSGLKDKQAVTKQWFSVLTEKQVDYKALDLAKARVIRAARHRSKLKRGSHQANYFEIIIRKISDQASVEQAIECVREHGVPNYFGVQRFGRSGNNIDKAQAMFSGKLKANRYQRGLYLSAARAFLFNQVLSERVKLGNWNKAIAGDVMMLAGTNSYFKTQTIDEEIANRLTDFDIHPSAPLCGKGSLPSSDEALSVEDAVLKVYPEFTQGLEQFRLRQQRRATRLIAQDLVYEWLSRDTLILKFRLVRGAFATTVLRELLTIDS